MAGRRVRLTGAWSNTGLVEIANDDGSSEWVRLPKGPVKKIAHLENFGGSFQLHVTFIYEHPEFYDNGIVELPD
ncbi:hypothetical protein [Nocardia otitidiscaviarum]|uniref:hypothetical protein n=1 Tax=Nocardia otitidiscaviarum TaxID=1823 RepID=UPI002456D2E3|nr:hypothetical protein [Nocardia otitidiscaviarum]